MMYRSWDKKTSYCIQNLFVEEGVRFYYSRLLLNDIAESSEVFPILREINGKIKFGTFCMIENEIIKWSFVFTVATEIDKTELIEKLKKTRVRPATAWEEDILFLGNDVGYIPEYPIIGFQDMSPHAVHTITLAGGLWYRMMKSMDDQFTEEGTDIVLYEAGRNQGSYMASERENSVSNLFKIPRKVSEPGFVENIKRLFRAYGYCDIKKIEIDAPNNKLMQIEVNHSAFNIRNFTRHEENAPRGCHFQRGIFDGFFTALLGTEHEFEEVECEGMGNEKCVYDNSAT